MPDPEAATPAAAALSRRNGLRRGGGGPPGGALRRVDIYFHGAFAKIAGGKTGRIFKAFGNGCIGSARRSIWDQKGHDHRPAAAHAAPAGSGFQIRSGACDVTGCKSDSDGCKRSELARRARE